MARGGGRPRTRGRRRLLRDAGRAKRRAGPDAAGRAIEAPILALQAGDDQHITAEHNQAFEQALRAAGVEHELVTYARAPHSFFDRRQEDFADASEDAWNRVLDFLRQHAPWRDAETVG